MAERRMFARTIIDSDAFLDMPLSAQALYFHLSMRADDEGFINNPRKIQRMIGASDDDLKLLIAKKFLIAFDTGVVVIKHWRIHNYIRSDRFTETVYQEEKAQLLIKENKAYSLTTGIPSDYQTDTTGIPDGYSLDTECRQNGYSLDPQDRLGKDRLGKDRLENTRAGDPVEEYTDNPDLQDAIRDFIKMRKAMKKPMTDRAIGLMLNKLQNLSDSEDGQIEILNQSIEHNWQSVYPLDEKKPQTSEAPVQAHPEWDYAELQRRAEERGLQR